MKKINRFFIKMDLLKIFVEALHMLQRRGFNTDIYSFAEEYQRQVDIHIEYNEPLPKKLQDKISPKEFSKKVRKIVQENFNYGIEYRKNGDEAPVSLRELYSFVCFNKITGYYTLVYFERSEKEKILVPEFGNIIDKMETFCLTIRNHDDYCQPDAKISGVIITKSKLGYVPKERESKIKALEIFDDSIFLCDIENNCLQSQVDLYDEEETKDFFLSNGFEPSKIPSVVRDKDPYVRYIGAKKSRVVKYYRQALSEAQILDVEVSYRYVK